MAYLIWYCDYWDYQTGYLVVFQVKLTCDEYKLASNGSFIAEIYVGMYIESIKLSTQKVHTVHCTTIHIET